MTARIAASGDTAATIYVNGHRLPASSHRYSLKYFDVTSLLRDGWNVISASVAGGRAGGGLFVQFAAVGADGEMIRISSDESWQSTDMIAESVQWMLPKDVGGDDGGVEWHPPYVLSHGWGRGVTEMQGNLLANPDFSQPKEGNANLPEGWEYDGAASYFRWDGTTGHSSRGSLVIDIPSSVGVGSGIWSQVVAGIDLNAIYEVKAWFKTEGVARVANGVYLSVAFLDETGKPLAYHWSDRLWDDNDWTEISFHVLPVKGTAAIRVVAAIHANGRIWVDDASLELVKRLPPADMSSADIGAPVKVEIDAGSVVNPHFVGIGAENDPFLWVEAQRRYGVTDEDYDLVTNRIREIRPGFARIFTVWRWWKEPGQWGGYVWDSPRMSSLYRTLDLYQELGTPVLITLVDWEYDPWADAERAAEAAAQFIEHLVKTKGYSVIRYVTTDNEPSANINWSFAKKKRVAELVYAALKKRGLTDKVGLVEPDEERGGRSWVLRATKQMAPILSAYSAHFYPFPEQMELAKFMTEDRVNMIRQNDPDENKPFFIMEFNVIDARFAVPPDPDVEDGVPLRTQDANPLVETYEGGLATADFLISVMNGGVSAVSQWNLFDEIYPNIEGTDGRLMTLGLWRFKHRNWEPRPVFYAYSLFTRYTGLGFKVLRTRPPASPVVKAVGLEDPKGRYSIFILNNGKDPVEIELSMIGVTGVHKLRKYVFSRDTIPTPDRTMLPPAGEYGLGPGGSLHDALPAESLVLYTDVE